MLLKQGRKNTICVFSSSCFSSKGCTMAGATEKISCIHQALIKLSTKGCVGTQLKTSLFYITSAKLLAANSLMLQWSYNNLNHYDLAAWLPPIQWEDKWGSYWHNHSGNSGTVTWPHKSKPFWQVTRPRPVVILMQCYSNNLIWHNFHIMSSANVEGGGVVVVGPWLIKVQVSCLIILNIA